MFWVIAGVLALAVGGLMIAALWRVSAHADPAVNHDIRVYRDQLSEVERDLGRGVIGQSEAERIRVEVSRRLLEADRVAQQSAQTRAEPEPVSITAAIAICVIFIGGALGLYSQIGGAWLPDRPLTKRIAEADAARADRPDQVSAEAELDRSFTPPEGADPSFLELIDRLRTAAEQTPEDLRGQLLLARNEALLGNFAKAHLAQAQVIALKGDGATADDHATHADLMVLAAAGYVSPEAEAALGRALELEPSNGPARYYTGLMYLQSGRPDLAFRIWRVLLAESRPNAPWVPPISAQIQQVAQAAGIRYTPPAAGIAGRGPSAEDMAAAAEMTEAERADMIRGMVDGLAERLADHGGPASDWARLIGALGVLGDKERAGAIWTEAQQVFAESPESMPTIRAAAESAGVLK